MTYNVRMITFIESPLFTRQVPDYLSDEEYAAFQAFLASSPDAGDVVKGGPVGSVRFAGNERGLGKAAG